LLLLLLLLLLRVTAGRSRGNLLLWLLLLLLLLCRHFALLLRWFHPLNSQLRYACTQAQNASNINSSLHRAAPAGRGGGGVCCRMNRGVSSSAWASASASASVLPLGK
jgi:hypothetical protein